MSDPRKSKPFTFELESVQREPEGTGAARDYRADFSFSTDDRTIVVPVWVRPDECRKSDVLRVAMHRLHLDLEEMARTTEGLRLDDAEYRRLVPDD